MSIDDRSGQHASLAPDERAACGPRSRSSSGAWTAAPEGTVQVAALRRRPRCGDSPRVPERPMGHRGRGRAELIACALRRPSSPAVAGLALLAAGKPVLLIGSPAGAWWVRIFRLTRFCCQPGRRARRDCHAGLRETDKVAAILMTAGLTTPRNHGRWIMTHAPLNKATSLRKKGKHTQDCRSGSARRHGA